MKNQVLSRAATLAEAGCPFVLASVVWRHGQSSGKPGEAAIIHPDGRVEGWLGGACAEPSVVREARSAFEDGKPRLMLLGPEAAAAGARRDDVVYVPMACENEGSLEVYLDPMLPEPRIVVVGRSPAVDTLASLADVLGWRAVIVDDDRSMPEPVHPEGMAVQRSLDFEALGIGEGTCIVVATQGHYDEDALEAALATDATYVGLVASRERAASVFELLRSRGVADDALARVHAPAGLDLGTTDHREIAVAVLAELVSAKAAGELRAGTVSPPPVEVAVDPVCGMTVETASARYFSTHASVTHYFCALGCKEAFDADPTAYSAP